MAITHILNANSAPQNTSFLTFSWDVRETQLNSCISALSNGFFIEMVGTLGEVGAVYDNLRGL